MNLTQKLSGTCIRGFNRIQARCKGVYSNFDEQIIIEKFLKGLKVKDRNCVDIAAGDGVTMSNTFSLFRAGWGGLAVEFDAKKFSRLAKDYRTMQEVNLAKCKVIPENVASLLKANQLPTNFAFLNLDIDGYDYFVLEQILSDFRPSLICVEVNEKIPPPVKFSVKWNPNYCWRGDHFYGQSISQLYGLCLAKRYSLVELHYNNAFLIPSELNPFPSLTPEAAYQQGYLQKSDRKQRFPWNANMEEVLTLPPEQAAVFINRCFEKYQGEFICEL